MKIFIPNFIRWYPIFSLLLLGSMIGSCKYIYASLKVDTHIPVSVIGVHHLGSNYFINDFYIDKSIGGRVGESGGGGGMTCCISLPKKWSPGLTVNVRWEVIHILEESNLVISRRAELAGRYQAQVPIEPYIEASDIYVHFFNNGKVRVIASTVPSSNDGHPIQIGDAQATQNGTIGRAVKEMFSAEELIEFQRQQDLDRKKYGDWR